MLHLFKKMHFVVLWAAFLQASAQQLPTSLLKNMKTRSIGPAVMSGRVTAIDAVVTNPEIIYAGTASGGVWKTENGGTTWTPIFDDQPTLNIGSLAIQQSNPSVIWVGTGEGNPRNSLNMGAGIYRSLDGGKSWKLMGLEKTKGIHRICIDPLNPNVLYAGVIGNPFADHPERGVFKTTDGGQTWEKVLYTNEKSGVGDMVMDPSNPNKLIVNMWEHRRTPWNFKSGGSGSGLYLTNDGGKTWKKLGKADGLPDGEIGHCGIAFARSNPNKIYAMVEATKNGFYRSDDGGSTWTKVTEDPSIVTNRPFYFNEIYVDPKNENRIFHLLTSVNVSEDGGKSYKTAAPTTTVHADHHAFWINPNNPLHIIDGNDGGLYISRDGGKKWLFCESLPLGQFYHINVDDATPYNVYGGLQDNGSWVGPAYSWTSGGIRNYEWQSVNGGDGFDVSPDPADNRYGYAMSQGGNLNRYDRLTGQSVMSKPTHPDLAVKLRFNWNAALAQDPHDQATIYYGSQFLHKSSNRGLTWEILSPDLTLNNKETQKLSDETGGLTLDITNAENHNTILTIAPSPKDKNVVWVGTDDGNVQLTRDGGKTWSNLSPKIGIPKEAWIPQIKASKYNAGEALVVMNNYRMGDMGAYIYRTRDFGVTWERIIDDTKVRGYALCIQQDTEVPNLLFAGTEHGLWVSIDDAKTWTQWKAGFPSVSTMDLAIQEREADLVIGTFGRALWVLDDIRPLRKIAKNGLKSLEQRIVAFDVPDAYMAQMKEPIGYWSGGEGLYEADNRSRAARLSFFVKVPAKADSTKSAAKTALATTTAKATEGAKAGRDSVFVTIFDENNKLIRKLRHLPDSTGIHRLLWNLDEESTMRMPGSPRPRARTSEGPANDMMSFMMRRAGAQAIPGKYKIVLKYADAKDSTSLSLLPDPRIPYNKEATLAKRQLTDRINQSTQKLTDAVDKLDDAKEVTDKLLVQLKDQDSKEMKDMEKRVKAMQDTLKAKRDIIIARPSEKQGISRSSRVTAQTKLMESLIYARSKPEITTAETRLVENLETMTKEATDKIENFFSTQWADFRKYVEANPVKLFK
ncbi:MAG: hypothetical protein MUE30_01090 [Spirosomaceae bacterium]|nr:hypothetical protein [Spirosomataceae bacterium]